MPKILENDQDDERYLRLKQHRIVKPEVLRRATLLVAGVGALGNEVLKGLALLGLGQIVIVDYDVVELSNLTRSVLFRATDQGRFKAEVAAEQVRQINPGVKVLTIVGDVTKDVGLGVFRRVQAVMGCLDSREARLYLNRLCWQAGVPFLDGSLGGDSAFYGGVRCFIPPDSACYGCTLSRADYQNLSLKYSCSNLSEKEGMPSAPTTPVEASIVAAMQVQQAIKLLHKLTVEGGMGRFYNGLTWDLFTVRYERQQGCPGHEEYFPADTFQRLPYRLTDVTPDYLLAQAKSVYGPQATVRFLQDVVVSLQCPQCCTKEDVYRVENELDKGAWPCPRCRTHRQARRIHLLEQGDELGHRTLAELGFPPLSVAIVEHEDGEICWEFCGDEAEFWRFF